MKSELDFFLLHHRIFLVKNFYQSNGDYYCVKTKYETNYKDRNDSPKFSCDVLIEVVNLFEETGSVFKPPENTVQASCEQIEQVYIKTENLDEEYEDNTEFHCPVKCMFDPPEEENNVTHIRHLTQVQNTTSDSNTSNDNHEQFPLIQEFKTEMVDEESEQLPGMCDSWDYTTNAECKITLKRNHTEHHDPDEEFSDGSLSKCEGPKPAKVPKKKTSEMAQRQPRIYTEVKLSKLTDEQLLEFMNLAVIGEEEEDFSSDDECIGPTFNEEDYEIRPENEKIFLPEQESDVFTQEIITNSLNINAIDTHSTSCTLNQFQTDEYGEQDVVKETASALDEQCVVAVIPSISPGVPPDTSTSTPVFKETKRTRSPLSTMEAGGPMNKPSAGGFIFEDTESISKDVKQFSKIIWRQQSMKLHVNQVAFRGNSSLPEDVKELRTPMQMFCYFFTKEILQTITEETNRTALTENINTKFRCNIEDLYRYIGVLIYMSLYRYPNLESYWSKNAFPPIQKTMTLTRFTSIKKYLSFRGETDRVKRGQPGYDPLFCVRNLANQLNERFDSIPKQARLCVDEQMCSTGSTKTKHHLRQYMPNKPHKWGFKLFVLSDSFGYAYRFEIYNGAGDNVILPSSPDLGCSANIVVRLTQTITNFVHHIIYFDNFYTSIPLLVYLRARGIYSLGTVRINRIPNCKLPTDNSIKDKPRGYSTEFVGTAYGIDISNVLWKDNKSIRFLSTYVGIEPFARTNHDRQTPKTSRYDRKDKKYVEIDCPQIVSEYNQHMGGVDLMDGLMGRYHIRTKSRDAITRLFYHFIDMAATNAYILYRRIHFEKLKNSEGVLAKDVIQLKLPEFREKIAAGLVTYTQNRSVGRPSVQRSHTPSSRPSNPIQQTGCLKVGEKVKHPVDDIRFDNLGHFPIWLHKEGGKKSCKSCKVSATQCFCVKCGLHLCCTNAKNCFYEYHNKK